MALQAGYFEPNVAALFPTQRAPCTDSPAELVTACSDAVDSSTVLSDACLSALCKSACDNGTSAPLLTENDLNYGFGVLADPLNISAPYAPPSSEFAQARRRRHLLNTTYDASPHTPCLHADSTGQF
jgi:hypothetical protein